LGEAAFAAAFAEGAARDGGAALAEARRYLREKVSWADID
jgi:hypothetical protein